MVVVVVAAAAAAAAAEAAAAVVECIIVYIQKSHIIQMMQEYVTKSQRAEC